MNTLLIALLLFLAMFVIVPVFYYIGIAVGFLPLLYVAVVGTRTASAWHFLGVAVWGMPMLVLCTFVARRIARQSGLRQVYLTVGSLLLLLAVGFLPMYGAGHEPWESTNVYVLYRQLDRYVEQGLL